MEKVKLKPQTMLMPLPAVMVSCAAEGYKPNIITISWIGIVNSEPPMLSISVTPQRFSYNIIKKSGQFVVNLTGEDNLKQTDFCGTKSGRDYDKFEACNLEAAASQKVGSPIIKIPGRHYECRIVYKSAMDPAYLDGTYDVDIYPDKDYHTLYFGEIVDCYELD